MTNETTDESNAEGKKADTPKEEPDKPISLYDKTEAIVTRQEAANKKASEILDRQEKLHANQRLAGTSGGKVEPTPPEKISDEEYADKLQRGEVDPLGEDGISID